MIPSSRGGSMKTRTVTGFGLCTALLLLACSQDDRPDQPRSDSSSAATPAATKPAPFDKGSVKIALVQYSGAGDYFQLWTEGARKQADAIGFTMQHYDAKADDARQAADLKSAIGSGVAGDTLGHGAAPPPFSLFHPTTSSAGR